MSLDGQSLQDMVAAEVRVQLHLALDVFVGGDDEHKSYGVKNGGMAAPSAISAPALQHGELRDPARAGAPQAHEATSDRARCRQEQ